VCSLLGLIACGAPAVVGVALSAVGLRQIKARNGVQTGRRFAIAGILIGSAFTLLNALLFAVAALS
jgi:hypothetical protein